MTTPSELNSSDNKETEKPADNFQDKIEEKGKEEPEKILKENSEPDAEDNLVEKGDDKPAPDPIEKSAEKDETLVEKPVDKSKPTGKYEIVKVEIKHGPLRKAVPKMPLPLAYVCCVLNIIFPSSGTLVSAFSVFCCSKTEHENILHGFGYNVLAAFLQIISLILIIGWVWSIMWGILFVKLALKEARAVKDPPPTEV